MTRVDLATCREVVAHYAHHDIEATDASLVVMADRFGTGRIAAHGPRHFRVLRGLDGQPFTLLP